MIVFDHGKEQGSNRYEAVTYIQDSTINERYGDILSAKESIVRNNRIFNNVFIPVDAIEVHLFQKRTEEITIDELKLLKEIKSGEKVVLPFNHYLVKYNLTEKECEIIQKIREGELKVS